MAQILVGFVKIYLESIGIYLGNLKFICDYLMILLRFL